MKLHCVPKWIHKKVHIFEQVQFPYKLFHLVLYIVFSLCHVCSCIAFQIQPLESSVSSLTLSDLALFRTNTDPLPMYNFSFSIQDSITHGFIKTGPLKTKENNALQKSLKSIFVQMNRSNNCESITDTT